MTSYDEQFGHLHGQMIAPKRTQSVAKKKPKLKTAKPTTRTATKADLKKTTPKNEVPGPPPPPGSLGIPDLPPDIEAIVAQILASDPTNGAARALAYIRGTAWYKTTYFGIAGGIKSGVISDEAGYRAWVSQVRDTFTRFYGRPPTPNEIAAYLASGFAPTTVEQIGGGHAWANANQGDVQYTLGAFGEGRLTQAELETLGQQNVGRETAAGAGLQTKLQQAAARMQRIFEGVLASPNFQIGGAGISAPSLTTTQKPDVGA